MLRDAENEQVRAESAMPADDSQRVPSGPGKASAPFTRPAVPYVPGCQRLMGSLVVRDTLTWGCFAVGACGVYASNRANSVSKLPASF